MKDRAPLQQMVQMFPLIHLPYVPTQHRAGLQVPLRLKSPLSAHTRCGATGTRASRRRLRPRLARPSGSPWPEGSFWQARKFSSGIYPCRSQEARLPILGSTDLQRQLLAPATVAKHHLWIPSFSRGHYIIPDPSRSAIHLTLPGNEGYKIEYKP